MPLFKKGDKSDSSNYRPVSLSSPIGKVMERVVFKNLYNHLQSNNLLYKYQSGFVPGHSTTFQLIDFYHHICQSELLDWIADYLTNRQQCVTLNSISSDYKHVQAGVPQGSVLGPLLFLVYVNDIADQLLSLTRLFADDSSLFFSCSNLKDIEGILNHDLIIISAWAKQWLVNFNPQKTIAMLFSLMKPETIPRLIFDGVSINFVDQHKHLGVTLTDNGKWQNHIENIMASASKVIGVMRKLKYTFSRIALNQIYISYARPILEYSSIVWDNCTVEQSNSLEKLQNEAARIVTGLTKSVSLERLYAECG